MLLESRTIIVMGGKKIMKRNQKQQKQNRSRKNENRQNSRKEENRKSERKNCD